MGGMFSRAVHLHAVCCDQRASFDPLLHLHIINGFRGVIFRYTTSIDSKDVNFNSCVMHRFYEQEVKEGGGGHSAVHLVMDPSLDDGKVSIRAYISKNIKLGDILQFQEIPVEIVATPAERVGGRVLASPPIYPPQTLARINP